MYSFIWYSKKKEKEKGAYWLVFQLLDKDFLIIVTFINILVEYAYKSVIGFLELEYLVVLWYMNLIMVIDSR